MAGNSDIVATLVGPDNKTTRMCWGPHTVATLAAHLIDLGFSPTQEVIIHQMGQRREATLGGAGTGRTYGLLIGSQGPFKWGLGALSFVRKEVTKIGRYTRVID